MKTSLRILCCIIASLLGVSINVAQQTNDASLNLFIEGVKVKGKDIPTVLENIAHSYKIPIGFELPFLASAEVEMDKNKKPEKAEERLLIPQDGTLEEVLNELLGLDSKYSWKMEAGVINIVPLTDRDMVTAGILDTQLELFEFEERAGVMSVGDFLVKTLEVKSKLDSQNIAPIHFYYANDFITPHKGTTKLTHRFEQTPVRQVLNWVVKTGTPKFWMVARWGNKYSYITIITS